MSIFGWGFSGTKLKPQLKMAVHRISIASNKKSAISKQNMKQVAMLLNENPPKEEKARIRAEALIRDDNMIEAYEIIQLECELLSERIKLIEHSQSCPSDMLSCVSTLIYACNRVDIPELQEIRKLLRSKYGKKFEENAMRNAGGIINERVVSKLSVHPPVAYLVQTYLEKICEQYEVDWKPAIKLSLEQMVQPTAAPVGYSVQVGQGTGLGRNISSRECASYDEQSGKPDLLAYSSPIIAVASANDNDMMIPPLAPGQTSNIHPIVMATPEYPSSQNNKKRPAVEPMAPPAAPSSESDIYIPPAANSKFDNLSVLTETPKNIPPLAPSAPSTEDYQDLPSAPATWPNGSTNKSDDSKKHQKIIDSDDDADDKQYKDLEARFNAQKVQKMTDSSDDADDKPPEASNNNTSMSYEALEARFKNL